MAPGHDGEACDAHTLGARHGVRGVGTVRVLWKGRGGYYGKSPFSIAMLVYITIYIYILIYWYYTCYTN